MKFTHQLVISSLAVLVLSACAGDPAKRRQAKDDFEYLDVKLADAWVLAPDAQPEFYPQYNIPDGEFTGSLGSEVDIRPPQQVLELIPGARVDSSDGNVTLWLLQVEDVDKVWQTIHRVGKERDISFKTDTDRLIETDWMDLTAEDEEYPIASRYKIEKITQGSRNGIKVSLIDWREDGKVMELTPELTQRYSSNMANYITSQYDQQLRDEARIKAQELIKRIPVSMGKDRSGLPVIIARAPYDVMWEKLETILPQLGFEIESKNRSQGTMDVDYDSLDDTSWEAIGVKPLSIEERKYSLLVGDLDNRTSINITDAKGKPITEEQLANLIPALVKMFESNGQASASSDNLQAAPGVEEEHSASVNDDEAKQKAKQEARDAAVNDTAAKTQAPELSEESAQKPSDSTQTSGDDAAVEREDTVEQEDTSPLIND